MLGAPEETDHGECDFARDVSADLLLLALADVLGRQAQDIDRDTRGHLAFGYGPQFCLGAGLARLQTRALLGELPSRTSWPESAGQPQHLRSNFRHGVKTALIRWTR